MPSHDFMLKYFEEFEFPTNDEITEKAEVIYNAANDVILMYRGHYGDLMRAFQLFIATGCRPYAYLGAARVLIGASYLSGGAYEDAGLDDAQKYLDNARAIIPNHIEIPLQQARIYVSRRDYKKFKEALDQIGQRPEAKNNLSYCMLQIRYWEHQRDMQNCEIWHSKAQALAVTNSQKLDALNRLASAYMGFGNDIRALQLYEQVVKLDPNDPWAWHNMSIMANKRRNFSLGGQYNRNALNIMEFGVAYQVLGQLISIWRNQRHENIVKEVPRYLSQEKQEEKKATSFLGRFFS